MKDGDNAPRSQPSFAYEAIRNDIMSGRHRPDAKLKVLDLAAALEVSPGAVREALSRLVPEELVVSRDQRGFAVAPLSIEDLEDLTDLRCEVEAIALRRSLTNGDLDWEAALLAATHRLLQTQLRTDEEPSLLNPAWIAAHAAFHHALVAAAGNARLLALHAQLYEKSERYRGLSAHYENGRDATDEHRQISELALARDVDGTLAAMLHHFRETTQLIKDAARNSSTQ